MARVVLLVPSSTYRAAAFLAAAGELGVEVVVASDKPMAPLARASSLVLDLDDPDAVTRALVDYDAWHPVDAVLGVDDRGVVAAAAAARALGLPHSPPAAVAGARDKLVMRQRLDSAEVAQPSFVAVDPADEAALRRAGGTVGYPCVVKPTTLAASQGVIRADDPGALVAAARRSADIARRAGVPADQPLLVERFVAGAEVAVEAVLDRGVFHLVAVFDKPDPLDGPYFEETIYVTPSRLALADRDAVTTTAAAACRALGLDHGPVHAELRVNAGRASVIEVAPRTIGGLCSRTVEIGTGQRLEAIVLANALGWAVPAASRHRAAGVLMLPPPRPGRLESVDGVAEAEAVPGIVGVSITVPVGSLIAPAPEGARYLGFVHSQGLTPHDAEAALRVAWRHLTVRVVDPQDP